MVISSPGGMRIALEVVRTTCPNPATLVRAAVAVEDVVPAIVIADPGGRLAIVPFVKVGVIVTCVEGAVLTAVPMVPFTAGAKNWPCPPPVANELPSFPQSPFHCSQYGATSVEPS